MKNSWLGQIAPHVYTVWKGAWKEGTVEPQRILFDHELVVVSQGECRVWIGTKELEFKAGSFVIVPPGVLHTSIASPGGVFRQCLHFDWQTRAARRRGLPLWLQPPRRPRATDLRLAPNVVPGQLIQGSFRMTGPVLPLLDAFFARWQAGSEFDRATCHGLLQEILINLLWDGPRRGGRDRAAQLADQVKERIDSASHGEASVQNLLSSLGFSYAHLCRIFSARFGISPVRYRNAVRLERARQLLRDPRRTVAEVAYEAGFGDPAYFTRKFVERHGTPPSRWR